MSDLLLFPLLLKQIFVDYVGLVVDAVEDLIWFKPSIRPSSLSQEPSFIRTMT